MLWYQRWPDTPLDTLYANHTYFVGEVMSFANVELCARYSEALVQRHFA